MNPQNYSCVTLVTEPLQLIENIGKISADVTYILKAETNAENEDLLSDSFSLYLLLSESYMATREDKDLAYFKEQNKQDSCRVIVRVYKQFGCVRNMYSPVGTLVVQSNFRIRDICTLPESKI